MEQHLMEIFRMLLERHGPQHWWPAETPFEVCVGAILTQNTNWVNVEKAIARLKQAGVLDPASLERLPLEQVAELIRPAGFFNVKGRRLKGFVTWLGERYSGSLERLFSRDWQDVRRELLAINGIGPETADAMLLYAGQQPTFVVDAYTKRIFSRLGLIPDTAGYEEVRTLFMASLPPEVSLYNEYHALIVAHAKAACRATPRCEGCPLRALCAR